MSTLFGNTATVPRIRPAPPGARSHQSTSWAALAAGRHLWRAWSRRARQRTALSDLAENDHLLCDIGLTRDEALGEARKPFWR